MAKKQILLPIYVLKSMYTQDNLNVSLYFYNTIYKPKMSWYRWKMYNGSKAFVTAFVFLLTLCHDEILIQPKVANASKKMKWQVCSIVLPNLIWNVTERLDRKKGFNEQYMKRQFIGR